MAPASTSKKSFVHPLHSKSLEENIKEFQSYHTEDAQEEMENDITAHQKALQKEFTQHMEEYRGVAANGASKTVNLMHLKGADRLKEAQAIVNKLALAGINHLYGTGKVTPAMLEEMYMNNPSLIETHVQQTMGMSYQQLINQVKRSRNLLSDNSIINRVITRYAQSLNKTQRRIGDLQSHILEDEHRIGALKYGDKIAKNYGKKLKADIEREDLMEFFQKTAEPKKYQPSKRDQYLDDLPK